LVGDLFELILSIPQAVLAQARLDHADVMLPARALRILMGVIARPPGKLAATGRVELAQVAPGVAIAELPEQKRLPRAPARRERVEQRPEELDVAVEVIVVVLGELVEQPAVRLAAAAVVAQERVADERLRPAVERLEEVGPHLRVQLAPQRVEDERRMMPHLPHDPLVLERRLLEEEGR